MNFDIAARRAQLSPERVALVYEGRSYTYLQLDERARRLAGRLAEAGIGPGDRVSILALNHIAHVDLILATAKLGFIYTPFNHRLSEREQREVANYVRPRLLLHDDANAGASVAAASSGAHLRALDGYERWLEDSSEAPGAFEPAPDDIQMILFTGGTTGTPKGAMLPYRQGVANAVNTVFSWGLRDDDCVIQATPCFHAAVNAFTMPLLHLGARVVLQRAFEPGEYLQMVAAQRATVLFLVPTMYAMLASHHDFQEADLSSVRWAISGGAPCPEPIREAFAHRGVAFRQGYGLTEAGVNCFAIELAHAAARPDSVGHPVLHGRAAVRSPDGTPVKRGEVGELTLAGPHLFAGYFDRPEETAAVLRDGWLWTGDLARQDDEGFYYLVGRRKEMFISGGENVFPAEIENVLYRHPLVAECCVVGVPDERWGEVGLAAVVVKGSGNRSGWKSDSGSGSEANIPGSAGGEHEPVGPVETPSRERDELAEELRRFLRGELAGYKVPKRFLFLSELPKSGAGKVLRRELAGLAEEAV